MNNESSPFDFDEDRIEEINISPLIDVIFILLLFFVVTSVFIEEQGIEIEKPVSQQAQSLDTGESISILITSDQQIYVGEIKAHLNAVNQILSGQSHKPAIIRADGSVRTDFLVKVMDEIKLAGIEDISLATKNEDNEIRK